LATQVYALFQPVFWPSNETTFQNGRVLIKEEDFFVVLKILTTKNS
jgi:hypothetical protein